MALPDYYDLIDPLELPIRGKTYRIPPASALDMIRFDNFAERIRAGEDVPGSERIPDDEAYRMFLGDVLDELRADGVQDRVILHVFRTAYQEAKFGREAAEFTWSKPFPKAPTTAKSQQNEPSKTPRKASPRSRSTGGASKTR